MINIKKIFIFLIITFVLSTNLYAAIKDSLFATIGNKAITRSDIINEIKIILILNGQSYIEEDKDNIENTAINSIIRRTIKKIEIDKYESLNFNKADLEDEISSLSKNLNIDSDTFSNLFIANGIDFSIIEDQLQTELLWNSLIFQLYKERLSINSNEIEEQLKLMQEKKEIDGFLISELIIKPVPKEEVNNRVQEIMKKIEVEGFEQVARSLSISETSIKGGKLGWVNENEISEKFRIKIKNTGVGNISEPILMPEGILFFKVLEKKKVKMFEDIKQAKKLLIHTEKTKILNMHSLSHYDNLRRSVTINYY